MKEFQGSYMSLILSLALIIVIIIILKTGVIKSIQESTPFLWNKYLVMESK